MSHWGGARQGAGRKPKEPGRTRVSISTRISDTNSQRLRAVAARTGKTLGEVLDEVVAYAMAQPGFETLVGELGQDEPTEAAAEPELEAYEQVLEIFERTARDLDLLRQHHDRHHDRARTLTETWPYAVAWADVHMRLRLHNEGWAGLFKGAGLDLRGHDLEEVLQGLKPSLGADARTAASGQSPQRMLFELPDETGAGPWLELTIAPVRGQEGSSHGVVLLARKVPTEHPA